MDSIQSDKTKSAQFDKIQQQLMKQMLEKPELASQLMSGKLNPSSLMEMLGGDLVSQMTNMFSNDETEKKEPDPVPETKPKAKKNIRKKETENKEQKDPEPVPVDSFS